MDILCPEVLAVSHGCHWHRLSPSMTHLGQSPRCPRREGERGSDPGLVRYPRQPPPNIRYRSWPAVVLWGSRSRAGAFSQQQLSPQRRRVLLQGPRRGLGPGQDPCDGGESRLLPPTERALREGAQVGTGCECGVGGGWVPEEGTLWLQPGFPQLEQACGGCPARG